MYKMEETMIYLPATKMRENLSDVINRVAYRGERIVLRRRGKDLAAVVSIQDLAFLDELENYLDVESARKALKEKRTIPWLKLKKQLGL